MASPTKITNFRRKQKTRAAGRARKAALAAKGSTPVFPIHTPESHANAPIDQLPPSARPAEGAAAE